jgi:hypothetical protein
MRQLQPNDRWSLAWPICWASLGLLVTILAIGQSVVRAFYEFDEAIGLLLLIHVLLWTGPWLILAWTGAMAVSLCRIRWRRLISAMIGPVLGFAIPFAYYASGISPRFLIERPRFERIIASLPKHERGRRVFYWDESGFAGLPSISSYIVYDETDTFADEVRAGRTRWASHAGVTPMGGHFFLVMESSSL